MALQKVVRNMLSTGVSDSSDATAITIDSSERVGIGMSPNSGSLNYAMDIQATTAGNALRIKGRSGGGNEGWLVWTDNSNNPEAGIYATSDNLIFANTTSYTERMRIDSSGNVGIGTTSPTGKLEIAATGTNAAPQIKLVESGDTREFNIYNDGSGNGHLVLADSDDDTSDTEIVLNDNGIITMLTGNSERMRIDSSGNVGIGTTSPSRILDVEVSGGNALGSVVSGTSSLAGIVMGDTGADDQGGVIYNNDGDYLYFRTGGAERARILNGGGLTFNGDTAAANALDDYEEGTWTPTFGGASGTYVGKYTKIGDTVHLFYHFLMSGGMPTSSAQVQIGGLPFTSSSSYLSSGSIYARYYTPNDSTLTTIIMDGESVIRLVNINETSFDYTIYAELEASSNNAVYIIGQITYTVT